MAKNKFFQLEFFPAGEDKTTSNLEHFNSIKDSQKLVLFILSFLFVGIISYCWGYKQGKRIALLSNKEYTISDKIIENNKEVISNKIERKEEPLYKIEKKEEPLLPSKEKIDEEKNKVSYTIQVATYKNIEYAQREAEKLKKRGFQTMIINKGNYIILCVGSFLDKKEANVVLVKLKKNYEDCFIRRL